MSRSKESYIERISVRAPGTQVGITTTINAFLRFCAEKRIDDPIAFMKKSEEDCFDLLQNWISFNDKNGKAASTIKQNFSNLKGFLYYMGIKITKEDVRANLLFPKTIREEPYPLSVEEVQKILDSTISKKAYYLTLLSSGMRMGEALRLRKRDFDYSKERVMIRIPARFAKTRDGRTTFISKEAASFLSTRMEKIGDDDLVFATSEKINNARSAETMTFHRILAKAGLDQRYYGVKRRKISLHSLRAFFFTKATRIIDENYAHKLTGHGGYLPQYDRLTDDEKLEFYLKVEPYLVIYDQYKKNAEIDKLRREKEELEQKIPQLIEEAMGRIRKDMSQKGWKPI